MVVGSDEYDHTNSESHRRLTRLSTWDWPPQCWTSSIVTLEEYTHSVKFPEYTVMKIKEIPNCLERDSPSCLVVS